MTSPKLPLFLFLFLVFIHSSYSEKARKLSPSFLERIKHVVVLMQENRSFDNVFGFFNEPKNLENLLNKQPFYNLLDPKNATSPRVYTGTGSTYTTFEDPNHGHESVTFQLYAQSGLEEAPYPEEAPMSGFLCDNYYTYGKSLEKASEVMKSFKPEELPIFKELAKNFAVFDRWFSSIPGPTHPNRMFLNSATSFGFVNNDKGQMALGYPQRTIFDSLVDAGKDFKVYFHDLPSVSAFRSMRHPGNAARMRAFEPVAGVGGFEKDCSKGNLDEYTFIEPRYFDYIKGRINPSYANDDHPPHDVRRGQHLIKRVYEAIRNSPIWNSTLLIITYDEHGGLYDHVSPPSDRIPNPDGLASSGFNFDRLGVRVPTIMISPWIEKGTVVSSTGNKPFQSSEYEHSSVPATLKKLFKLDAFLTRRDRWAGTFEHLWTNTTLTEPRTDCPTKLPDAPEVNGPVINGKETAPKMDLTGKLTEMQEGLVQLAKALNNEPLLSQEELDAISKLKAREIVVDGWQRYRAKLSPHEK